MSPPQPELRLTTSAPSVPLTARGNNKYNDMLLLRMSTENKALGKAVNLFSFADKNKKTSLKIANGVPPLLSVYVCMLGRRE